ncbi:peptidase S9 [Sorangium cellulosum]|uniref:prolyl oligopeptidase n=2 Tax=Sorangium cellulosum TaxID=56 RepID=A0A2L0FA00_SORCE|nr:prolyl oligopeptidase family serine peptidase [Sorangium cellulosum]AUX48341.1 peptidase S9 [Sorangium cellulosum]
MKYSRCLLLAALLAGACGGTEAHRPVSTMTANPSPPLGAASAAPTPADRDGPAYPPTRVDPVKYTLHGVEIADPYRWLEDGASPEVQAWMKAQQAFTRAELDKLPERGAIASRLKQLFYIDAVSAPRHRRGRYFLSRRHATKEKSIVYWKQGKGGEERALLDPNSWSDDGSVSLGGWEASWDGKNVAYKVQKNNSDEATLHVMDVASGKRSEVDVIEGGKYAYPSWTPSGDGFYYVWLPTDPSIAVAERPGYAEVRFHRLGQDPQKDRVVRGRTGDPRTFLGASLSKDGRFLVLTVAHGWTSTDVYFRDLRRPGGQAADRPLIVGSDAHYSVEVYKDRFYVHTDEGAPRYRLFEVDPDRPERAAWKEIVPERADATLDSVSIVGGQLALGYLKDASSRVEIRSLDGKLTREVPLPGIGTVGGPYGLPDEDEAYFSFESFTSPQEIHATSIKTGKTELYARIEVPVDPSPYTVEQAFFPSRDGTRVSMFIVRRKDMKKDGSARALLYGYGGFQISQTPAFTGSIHPWLERGGVYAVANLRGGGEYGEAWHRDGMLLKKQNVFDDFIAAAEHLIREGYTRPEGLAIQGGSNGGLLVGAAITQRPDLFGAALCSVPLLDMVRYHLFGSGKTWISEYGSADDLEQFKALHAYSPYHRVKPGTRYPAVLLLSADSDDRVDPMHARKLAAALQAASAGGPVLLRIERNAGHAGADLIRAAVEKGADQIAFALAATGAPAPASR